WEPFLFVNGRGDWIGRKCPVSFPTVAWLLRLTTRTEFKDPTILAGWIMEPQTVRNAPDVDAGLAHVNHHGLHVVPAAHHHHFSGLYALAEHQGGPGRPQVMKANPGQSYAR